MRISSKGRYGLAAMISVAQLGSTGEFVTVISIAEKLGISKIYLEQVFSLLKRSKLVTSIKGSQGGYQLSKPSEKITVLEILQAVEISLFEKTERSVSDEAMEIESSLKNLIWDNLDNAVVTTLGKVTLSDLVAEADKAKSGEEFMFYI
ncbi:RrF2 family transcriptional regulator [Ruminiclostridium cellobioparum]|jgi:Rrf2 family cysteine metabolism transcriptional repressor|uniref:Rrf2 family protein (Putative transcriptional regulator) n=1 Tax=Ruminiclostridium cellobioparum subsp. termitidis CT1112 TaxID=1195236 RepID=S0FR56_RUMCE|nr:Rrf2 family transcriptional regulator [Ruminiclostridium cellobioparum]EMS70953.1 rrf2 family protein (putative transcriptional regulator) [Ruminiclostridium cellobioparum subsp. termitidis CT1112]